MTPAGRRRRKLVLWMREPRHEGLSARQIADISGIYDEGQRGRADRCFDDLAVLAGRGVVYREGRPARWYLRVEAKVGRHQ